MNFNIETLKRKMLVKYPFFGSIVANTNYIENNQIKTAATNGEEIVYNKEFLEKLDINQQLFVLVHEVCHIAFNHIERSKEKNNYLWNIATDAVINAFLKNDGLKEVPGIVEIKDAINYDAEELYQLLLKKYPNSNNEKEYESHEMWKDNISKLSDEVKEKQSETEKLGERDAFRENIKAKKEALEDLKKELLKESINTMDTSENIINVSNIGSSSLIDWRYILKEAIKYDVDWSYKNATFEYGVLTPNLEELPFPETEILLDTSGSIDNDLLKNFLKECKNILKKSKVKVGCFDTKFYNFQEIKTEEDIDKMKFIGGGGTNFDVAINSFSRRVENKIIFTDGKSLMPKKYLDVIWIVFGEEKINPLGGKVIYITKDKIKRKTR